MSHPLPHRQAVLPPDLPPLLTVIVDTEEEFDWSRPLARENVAVTTIPAQRRAHALFDRYGIVPTYVVDWPVATSPVARDLLGGLQREGRCGIGAHLHPWVNPPHEEVVSAAASYAGNLPPALEREKLRRLTEAIAEGFGRAPTVYRAGRYGLGPETPALLLALGYRVDSSVVPWVSFAADGGPDFRGYGIDPFWFGPGGRLLELPLTAGFTGPLRGRTAALHTATTSPLGMRLRLPGLLARSGLFDRIRLSPEGLRFEQHRRLVETLLADGRRIFSYTYHSPSLAPGHTPYVRSGADLDRFLTDMERFFDFFRGLGGRFTTPEALHDLMSGATAAAA